MEVELDVAQRTNAGVGLADVDELQQRLGGHRERSGDVGLPCGHYGINSSVAKGLPMSSAVNKGIGTQVILGTSSPLSCATA